MGEIVVFSKSNCHHCQDAKSLLNDLDIPFTEIDIEADIQNSMLMSLASQRHTVPQIFFNDDHIGGADDLKKLEHETIINKARQALEAESPPDFLVKQHSPEELGRAIIALRDVLDQHLPDDPTALPEYRAVRIWYSTMFGFLCNLYDQMSLTPEPMALFIGALSSMMSLVEKQVGMHFGISCLSTAFAANCSYCSAHGADLSMKYAGETPEDIKALFDYLQNRKTLDELPFDDKLKAIINLSARMTTQEIQQEDIEYARSIVGKESLTELIHSIGGMGCIMGFLNRFNDLVGVEIEASIKQTIDNSALAEEWDWGTHGTEDQINRHDYRDQQVEREGLPTRQQFKQLIDQVLSDVFIELGSLHAKYASFNSQLLPDWINTYPDSHSVQSVSTLYHAAFNTGELESETKHLAAYVLALGSNHPHMACEELRITEMVTHDGDKLLRKLEELQVYAQTGELPEHTMLDAKEVAAMKLARVSQTFPHEVMGALVMELSNTLSPVQIVELVVSLSVIGMGQRWTNITSSLDLVS